MSSRAVATAEGQAGSANDPPAELPEVGQLDTEPVATSDSRAGLADATDRSEPAAETVPSGASSEETSPDVAKPSSGGPGRYRTSRSPDARRPSTQAPGFEPMPPPTKRKAPRSGFGLARPASAATENAIDWALGRVTPPSEEATAEGAETATPLGRRRRSRRGRRGHGSANEGLAVDTDQQNLASSGPPADDQVNIEVHRDRQPPIASPQRDDRVRSQLGTFEGLVARQNVVLDALLTKVSSFANIERSLGVIERRLSGLTSGGAGAATPRVGIFVDVPNIIYAAERIGAIIDFGRLLNLLSRGRELVRASAYAPISDDPQQRLDLQKFVQPFMHRGYRIMTKPLKRFSDGTMKGNFDVELAMDVLTMSDRLDIVSLVSGDGDFSRLVEIVGSKGVRVEVVAFGTSTSAELRAISDDYVDISEHLAELT